MENIISWISSLPLEAYTFLLTFITGLVSTFGIHKKTIKNEDGTTRITVTKWGYAFISITLISFIVSVYIAGSVDDVNDDDKIKDLEKELELAREQVEKLVGKNNTMPTSSTSQSYSQTLNSQTPWNKLDEILQEIHELKKHWPSSTQKESSLNLPTDSGSGIQDKEISDESVTSIEDLVQFKYEITLNEIDVTQCPNSNVEGYYWDIKVGTETLAYTPPNKSIKSTNEGVVKIAHPPVTINNVESPSPEFSISGYIREMTGRSWIRRYYQYRYSGVFSKIVKYTDGKISIAIDARGDENGSECVLILGGNIEREILPHTS